jgi:hypothetical protein
MLFSHPELTKPFNISDQVTLNSPGAIYDDTRYPVARNAPVQLRSDNHCIFSVCQNLPRRYLGYTKNLRMTKK